MTIPRKPKPGSPLRGSPATSAQWIGDVTDAMLDYKLRRRLGAGSEPPHVEHYGHKIRCKLASGGPYPLGTPLEIGASLFSEVSREKDWHACALRSGNRPVGIAIEPARTTSATWVQLDGICPALVNVLDVDHTHAYVASGGTTLTSSFGGPIEILTLASDTGSQTLLIRLAAPLLRRKIRTTATISAGSSGAADVYLGGTARGSITAYFNWQEAGTASIASGSEGWATWCDDEEKWVIDSAECGA